MSITSDSFIEKMEQRWKGFGNVSSSALRYSWGQICQELNDKLRASSDPEAGEHWSVLCPPTGSGKTQGMIVYSAMQSISDVNHPGILIISRLIADTDEIASQINELIREYTNNPELPDQAISYHSEKKAMVKLDDLKNYPVLVITHAAYRLALDSLSRVEDTWEYLYNLKAGNQRKLVLIDEAIDIVDYAEIQQESIEALLYFSGDIADQFPSEVNFLRELLELFKELKNRNEKQHTERILLDESFEDRLKTDRLQERLKELNLDAADYVPPDFSSFKLALKGIPFDRKLFRKDQVENRRIYQSCLEITSAVDVMLKSFIFYSKNLAKPTFNTARLLVPPNVKGAVVFDATASSNVIYEIFDKARIVTPPEGTRSYSNVTIHFSYGHKVGKREMYNNALPLSAALISTLDKQFQGEERRKALVVTHKAVEPFLLHPSNKPRNFDLDVAHFGAVDGSNSWQHFDTVVIFGLPYKPKRWSPSIFMALQGVQDDKWLQDPSVRSFKNHPDIRQSIDRGQMIADIIQAVNRVRCRRVIDDAGNCPVTDIFILLPDAKAEAVELFEGVCKAMPEVNTKEWFYGHQQAKRRGRATSKEVGGSYDESLISYLNNLAGGDRVSASNVKNTLVIKGTNWDRLLNRLKDSSDPINQKLADIGVVFQGGKGKGISSYFLRMI